MLFTLKEWGGGIKILTPKQMLQRLPVAFAKVNTDIISDNLLNEIIQIVNSFYWAKKTLRWYIII